MEMERDHTTPPEPMKRKHKTQIISMIVGFFLVVIGLSGMLFSGFAGLHMNVLYSMIIAISGGILFYNGGFKNNSHRAYVCCLVFAIFFGLHALAGWIFGQPGIPTIGFVAPDPKLLQIIPNFHELGKHDHILNTILALVLMGGAIDWKRRHRGYYERHHKPTKRNFNQLVHH